VIGTDVVATIGDTPLVELTRVSESLSGRVFVKLENRNPLGSVKDRIARAMIEAAERSGELVPGSGQTIVEATSGNTGIALAYVGAVKGYRVVLTMPETMSVERRRLLAALGAELELTAGTKGMAEAVDRAEEISRERDGAILVRQFANDANPAAHEKTTGPEIIRATEGRVDAFVAGVGTGGTITGVGRALGAVGIDARIVAVEPTESPVLSGGAPGAHQIQGIGAGFVPPVLDRSLIDEVVTVSAREAANAARRVARHEGILGGISAGANVHAALQLAARPEFGGKTIVTVICDTGERYLTTWLYEEGNV
jgi:cysteine synthase A